MVKYVPIINTINFEPYPLDILRLDLIHPFYGGNKFFKLKYNLQKATELCLSRVLTFGGSHSNHIYSTAAICKETNIDSIGIIRGEEKLIEQSPTLQFAIKNGMKLHFVSREKYKDKTTENLVNDLKKLFGNFYLIPEGGSNYEGIKGCIEILNNDLKEYDYVFCACGTASTYSGIKISANPNQKIIGISVLKGENKLIETVNEWMNIFGSEKIEAHQTGLINCSTIINGYDFGGYAKYSEELILFKRNFEMEYSIPLDYIYTSKLVYAVFDLIKQGRIIKDSKILIIQSGGLQGNAGFEKRYGLV